MAFLEKRGGYWYLFFVFLFPKPDKLLQWETDLYIPQVLRGAALFDNSAPAVKKKFRVLRAQDFYTPLALNCQKGQRLPAPEVYI